MIPRRLGPRERLCLTLVVAARAGSPRKGPEPRDTRLPRFRIDRKNPAPAGRFPSHDIRGKRSAGTRKVTG